jgi:hypothetical protein
LEELLNDFKSADDPLKRSSARLLKSDLASHFTKEDGKEDDRFSKRHSNNGLHKHLSGCFRVATNSFTGFKAD